MSKKVVVVGGGIGGLSAALRLAKSGYEVHLYEKNKMLGGKMGIVRFTGYTFDAGPTLITMPFVIEELFTAIGYNISDFIKIVPIEPVCRYFFKDKTPFDASSDLERMVKNIDNHFHDESKNYKRFLKYAERIYKKTSALFMFSAIHEIKKLFTWSHFVNFLTIHQIDPFQTVHNSLKRFFRDPQLIQLFDRYPTYNGSNPYQAPATLNIIPYVELGLGGFYIEGGLYKLVEALKKIAQNLNVHIHTDTQVEQILHDKGRIQGVQIAGDKIDADVVLCNADVVVSHNDLITGLPQEKSKLNKLEPSISGIVFYWAVKGQHDQLKQHNIIFSGNYKQEFRQIFEEFRAPDDPTVYISISSKSNPQHAPPGCENWFILINMPYLTNKQKWDKAEIDKVRQSVIRKLKESGIEVAGKIEHEMTMTPLDIKRKFHSNRGSIYGISSNTKSSAFTRPANRSRQIKGLYFAGGSTHPGGGVPMCMLSGKIAAGLIDEFEGH